MASDIYEEIEKLGNVSDNWTLLRDILKDIVLQVESKKGKK